MNIYVLHRGNDLLFHIGEYDRPGGRELGSLLQDQLADHGTF